MPYTAAPKIFCHLPPALKATMSLGQVSAALGGLRAPRPKSLVTLTQPSGLALDRQGGLGIYILRSERDSLRCRQAEQAPYPAALQIFCHLPAALKATMSLGHASVGLLTPGR